MRRSYIFLLACTGFISTDIQAQSFKAPPTQKPPLHGKNWMAVTGKPLAATAGAFIFQRGGNAVDAACAMLAAACTMWDVLSWGGETQALIYNPKTKKVIGINALGVAPTGATPAFFKNQGMNFPPEYGPLAAITPGTPGGLCYMLAEYGTESLTEVLAPAMEMAAGYAIEAQTANSIERAKERIKQWPYSKAVLMPHAGEEREAPEAGEIFIQKDLLETLSRMVAAEQVALKAGKSRKAAIYAASQSFYGTAANKKPGAGGYRRQSLWLSLGGRQIADRAPKPGDLLLHNNTPAAIRQELKQLGYKLSFGDRTSGPVNAVYFDWKHGSFWGGSSNNGEDYGIGW